MFTPYRPDAKGWLLEDFPSQNFGNRSRDELGTTTTKSCWIAMIYIRIQTPFLRFIPLGLRFINVIFWLWGSDCKGRLQFTMWSPGSNWNFVTKEWLVVDIQRLCIIELTPIPDIQKTLSHPVRFRASVGQIVLNKDIYSIRKKHLGYIRPALDGIPNLGWVHSKPKFANQHSKNNGSSLWTAVLTAVRYFVR